MVKKNTKFLVLLAILSTFMGAYGFFSLFHRPKPNLQKALQKKDLVPVLVIGSGPAGLSAAMYTARAKLPTIVLAGDQPGGTLADIREIENWPGKKKTSGEEAIDDLEGQAQHFGATILNDSATDIDLSSWPFVVKTRDGKTFNVMSLILATGRIAKKLNVPGVEEFWGHGVGVCTICDAPFHKGQEVAVVGGGDTAGDRALQLAAFANKVYMVVKDHELDASGYVQDYLKKNKKIEILYNTELVSVQGDNDAVTGAKIFNNKTGKTKKLPIKGLYFAIGWHPNSDLVQKSLKLTNGNFIWVDGQTQQTSEPGVFATGDVATDPRYGKAGVATGSGVKGGLDAIKFLQSIGFNPATAEKYKDICYKPTKEDLIELETVNNLSQLNTLLQTAKTPVIVDFYTDYCPTCKALMPHLKTLAAQYTDKITIIKVDYDNAQSIVQHFNIPSVPYFATFKDGKLFKKTKKVGTKQDLENLITELLKK